MRSFRRKCQLGVAWLGLALCLAAAVPASAGLWKRKLGRHTATGTIVSFDAATKRLKLRTAKGPVDFSATGALVWSGARSVEIEDLESDVGESALVSYVEKDGERRAESVRVQPAAKARSSRP